LLSIWGHQIAGWWLDAIDEFTASSPPEVAAPPTPETPTIPLCDVSGEELLRDSPLAPPTPVDDEDIMSPRLFGGTGFYRVQGSATEPRAVSDGVLWLELWGPEDSAVGNPIGLTLRFRNRTKTAVSVVPPMDGTFGRKRYPHFDLYLRDETNQATYRFAFVGGGCGTVNPLIFGSLIEVSPKDTRTKPDADWANYIAHAPLPRPGAFKAWVVYRYCPNGEAAELSELNPDEPPPHFGVYASNAVSIRVREQSPD